MKSAYHIVVSFFAAAILFGCAGQTTDPRQGGLFSYNPTAYEDRLQERRENLADAETMKLSSQEQTSRLETEKSSLVTEKAALQAQLLQLSSSLSSLKKNIQDKQMKTAAQKNEQKRIVAEINSIKSSSKLADEMEDPEETRLELERLKKRRDELEKEAENLMLL